MVKKNFFDQKVVQMALVEISAPQNRPFWGGVVEIFSAHTKGSQSPGKIFLVIPKSFLGSVALLESKIADFRPKNRNFWESIWPKFLHVGVRPAPKIFSGPGYPKSISKKIFGFLTQNESRIMKKI